MKENAYLDLLKSALSNDFDFNDFKVYFIKGFELSAEYLKMFETSFAKDDFFEILEEMKCNPVGNNLIFFYLENNKNDGEIYLVSNSLKLHGREFVLKKFNHVLDEKILSIPNVQRIN